MTVSSVLVGLHNYGVLRRYIAYPVGWVGHFPFAHYLVSKVLKPSVICELGTHAGNSYFNFCQTVKQEGLTCKCYAVDNWRGDDHSGTYDEEVFRNVNDFNDSNYSDFSTLLKMDFDSALSLFCDSSIDLLHIDGLHTYNAVKHDFESWLPKLSDRAVVMFHDTDVLERNFGVHRLFDELLETYPGFRFTHSHGLGILLIGKDRDEALLSLCQSYKRGDELWNLFRQLFEALGRQVHDQYIVNETAKQLCFRHDFELS